MKARFHCRVAAADREGYYYTRWDLATPVVVVATDRQAAVNEACRLMGAPARGRYWSVKVDRIEPVEDVTS